MNISDIQRLAELLRQTPEIGAIEVRGWFGRRVVISRNGPGVAPPAPAYHAVPAPYAPAPSPSPGPAAAPASAAPEAPPSVLKEIKSPMVGTFYMAPEPGAEPYLKVGQRVVPGQTVCIIEAMKIMNEIEAEISGVVREVCLEDSTPVEFGQVLYRVDPHG